MSLRTKPTVKAGILHHSRFINGDFVEYQPGNGTRYPMVFVHLSGHMVVDRGIDDEALSMMGFEEGAATVLVFNAASGVGHVFRNEGYLAPSYVAEKFRCLPGDAAVLAELIAFMTARTAPSAGELPACERCNGEGRIQLAGEDWGAAAPCPECGGEGVRRASA